MQIPFVNQILLVLVTVTLSTVLTIAGIQVIKILREFRESAKTINKILEDSHTITSSVAKPISGISSFLMGLKNGMEVVSMFLNKGKGGKSE
ncbi:hypothetical protein COT64_01795 [Candidatus Shapirobacteria bacterium CG09_land_8_20_14_0_10_39_12]|uniref:DUF948 domain-containing protein n=1 Tax=Candidatus Shapirobacteria bacterium CG09_land_8_20_14_0_10_39_12 TaxID=1974885 RepID=A0A2H0WPR7_9BACT|nr:MAG: hypothetical protein COT64_01795 [Candidatus Shapirobacteria bacterium CG09_land_8_20_14_0_10_39_12]